MARGEALKPKTPEETFLTSKQVSERWAGAIKPKTLSNWRGIGAGAGPKFQRFGNKIMYRLDCIIAFEKLRGFDKVCTSISDYGKKS